MGGSAAPSVEVSVPLVPASEAASFGRAEEPHETINKAPTVATNVS
jgi:hypothetical protein